MPKKTQFKNFEEMVFFSKQLRKRIEFSSKREDAKFEKEKKVWEEYERSYDLELEKKKHEAYLKDLRKIIRGQKTLAEKVERMMRLAEKSGQTKTKKYKLVPIDTKSLVAENLVGYKRKER
jgi:uncharacterized protein YeaO (DUF488 family)